MTKLHEVLAAESTRAKAAELNIEETRTKFAKTDIFNGAIRNLKILDDSTPGKDSLESSESYVRPVVTSVIETLQYTLDLWAKAEDVRATKNQTNTIAKADLIVGDVVIAKDVPVDELMGLEARLIELKKLFTQAPSLDAKKEWSASDKWPVQGLHQTPVSKTVKTEKVSYGIIMAPATEKHPAQVKEGVKTVTIGEFTDQNFSAAMTTQAKAELISRTDDLIVACRQARNRANDVEATNFPVGTAVVKFLMGS